MKPIVSVLMATRKRPQILHNCLHSMTARYTRKDFTIIVRADSDDEPTQHMVRQFFPQLPLLVGEPAKDQGGTIHKYAEACDVAESKWVWMVSDDTIITGDWVGQFAKLPDEPLVVWPEFIQEGKSDYGSIYHKDEGIQGTQKPPVYLPTTTPHFAMPALRKSDWLENFGRVIPHWIDQQVEWKLRRDKKFRLGILDGVKINHLFIGK
jgi:glycosyltransferase involved in cell wall biosynthesis